MRKIEEKYHMAFPKGCSSGTIKAAKKWVRKHDLDALHNIAKLHFKLTDDIIESL